MYEFSHTELEKNRKISKKQKLWATFRENLFPYSDHEVLYVKLHRTKFLAKISHIFLLLKTTIAANSKFGNKFVETFKIVDKVSSIFCNFQLACILSFHKRYICPKKIFRSSKLFKKMWSQIPLFQQISTSEPNFP